MSDVPTRLLRETLQGRMESAPASGCIETDTLAAWADGTLNRDARAAAEAHASSCARCQALLAAMVRMAPPPAQPERSWRLSSLAWLTPVAAAAAAVLLWINTPRSPLEPNAAPAPAAVSTARGAVAAASEPGPAPPPAAAPSSPAAERAPAKARTNVPGVGRPTLVEAKTDERRAAPQDQAKDALQQQARAAAPPGTGGSDAKAAPPPAASAPAPPRADAPPQLAAADAAAQRNAAPPQAYSPPPAREMARAASGFRAEALKMVNAPAEVASPDGSIRWRLLADGGVARSTDRGQTWQTQVTGVLTPLTAGAAPAPTTCWLVGRGGVVVLSTDGVAWQRVQFPVTLDLIAVTATDALHATVTAAGGRTFTTADAGKTWR